MRRDLIAGPDRQLDRFDAQEFILSATSSMGFVHGFVNTPNLISLIFILHWKLLDRNKLLRSRRGISSSKVERVSDHPHRHAPVDGKGLAGDELVFDQLQNEGRDLLGTPLPAKRNAIAQVILLCGLAHRIVKRRADNAGRNAIDADVFGRMIARQCAGKLDEGGLDDLIGDGSGAATKCGCRR